MNLNCLACLNKLGMNSGLITDKMITASSTGPGLMPQDARAPVDQSKSCLIEELFLFLSC